MVGVAGAGLGRAVYTALLCCSGCSFSGIRPPPITPSYDSSQLRHVVVAIENSFLHPADYQSLRGFLQFNVLPEPGSHEERTIEVCLMPHCVEPIAGSTIWVRYFMNHGTMSACLIQAFKWTKAAVIGIRNTQINAAYH